MLSEKVQIFTFNVGQGDSHLIHFIGKNESSIYNILIDGGPADPVNGDNSKIKDGVKKAADHLEEVIPGEDINLLIISHYDQDHIGGLEEVINNHKILSVWGPRLSRDFNETIKYEKFMSEASKRVEFAKLAEALNCLKKFQNEILPIKIDIPYDGQIFHFIEDSQVEIQILSSGLEESFAKAFAFSEVNEGMFDFDAKLSEATSESNESSIVFRISSSEFSLLFTGDAGPEALQKVYDKFRQILRADILKVPHHGSKSACHEDFIKAAAPSYSVISVGKDNQYDHPDDECIELLKQYTKVAILRTDEEKMPRISFECLQRDNLKLINDKSLVEEASKKIGAGASLIYSPNGRVHIDKGSGRNITPVKPYFDDRK